ncbi:hypothetical protein DFJ74DRAFT_767803 [Hyaloraphidium curvatum]|nr:hypothetical protein DFJ74DRAFT_767803 [Hyaloraphidium curvatum]
MGALSTLVPRNPLLFSGCSEIALAVYFGWAIALFGQGNKTVGPFKNRELTLKAHLDYIMMGTIQIALSSTELAKTTPPKFLWPFIWACWFNPSAFTFAAISEKGRGVWGNQLLGLTTLVSFSVKTISWTYFAVKAHQAAL